MVLPVVLHEHEVGLVTLTTEYRWTLFGRRELSWIVGHVE